MSLPETLPETDYEDWKQIDGIFASLGVDGEVTEESILGYLHKDQFRSNQVGVWLNSIGLSQYENVLIINGFDDLFMLNGVLEEDDFQSMGFSNQNHVAVLLREISKLPCATPIESKDLPKSVKEWLESLKLEEYYENFCRNEYTTMDRILQIWAVELVSVLSIVLLGHQKRILASLRSARPGLNYNRNKISDISNVIKLSDIKSDMEKDIYFTQNFDKLQPKQQTNLNDKTLNRSGSLTPEVESPVLPRSAKDNISLERSDSGCSISSGGGSRPDLPERIYLQEIISAETSPPLPPRNDESPPELPKKKQSGHSFKGSTGNERIHIDSKQSYNTIAGYSRSHKTAQSNDPKLPSNNQVHYLTMDGGQKKKHVRTAQLQSADDIYLGQSITQPDGSRVPLVGNVEGLKFSNAESRSKRVLNKIKRPLPGLPPGTVLTFTAADLPPDFKGKHKPEILIDGCINYSSCYLGTCLVMNITGPESTREAIGKMKGATVNITKLPVVILSISYKGVSFIDSSSKRPICDHEITNIYCAAQDSESVNYFAYITKDVLTRGLYCHVFCVKTEDLSREIILTLGEAFDIAYYAAKKHPSLLDPDT